MSAASLSLNDFIKVLCVVFIWGFNFAAIKFTVADVPPLAMTFVRFSLTVLILLFLFKPNMKLFWKMIPVSLIMGIGHFGMLYVGVTGVDGSSAAILIQLGTPFSVLLALFVFKETMPVVALFGIAVSFIGAILLAGEPQGGRFLSMMIIVFSAFCWALANIVIKKNQLSEPLEIIFWVNLLALPGLFVLSFAIEENQLQAILNAGLSAWAGLIYTVVASSLVAYYLWYQLISSHEMNKVVPYSLAVPFIGVISTVLIHDEPLTMMKILGGVMTVLGVGLIYASQKRRKTA